MHFKSLVSLYLKGAYPVYDTERLGEERAKSVGHSLDQATQSPIQPGLVKAQAPNSKNTVSLTVCGSGS